MTETAITSRTPDAGQPAALWSAVGSGMTNLALIVFGLVIGAIIGLMVADAAGWLPAFEC